MFFKGWAPVKWPCLTLKDPECGQFGAYIMHFPSMWSQHTHLPLAWTCRRTGLILKSGPGQRERNIRDYRAAATGIERRCKQILLHQLGFLLGFPKHAHEKDCADETSTFIPVRHVSKVVCRVITARLPPAAEAQRVWLIFCVWLLRISQRTFTYHVTEAELCSRTSPDRIISAFILAAKIAFESRNAL